MQNLNRLDAENNLPVAGGKATYFLKKRTSRAKRDANNAKKPIMFYMVLVDPSGARMEISTHCRVPGEARNVSARWFAAWEDSGFTSTPWSPEKKESHRSTTKNGVPSCDTYLLDFWKSDSLYVRKQSFKGNQLSERYRENQLAAIKNYVLADWGPFKNRFLNEITPSIAEKWVLDLKSHLKGLGIGPSSVNRCLGAVKRAYFEACHLGIIAFNPFQGISKAKEDSTERIIPTDDELKRLFASDIWIESGIARLVCWTAAQTGMRLGEILGLQSDALTPTQIHVLRSWDSSHRSFTPPKSDAGIRRIPITEPIYNELSKLLSMNPWRGRPNNPGFVFWSQAIPDQPISPTRVEAMFRRAWENLGVTKEEQKRRGITPHALRHYFNSRLLDVMPGEKARRILGHSNIAMTQRYAHLQDSDEEAIRQLQKVL